jgi:hypothetical protein
MLIAIKELQKTIPIIYRLDKAGQMDSGLSLAGCQTQIGAKLAELGFS